MPYHNHFSVRSFQGKSPAIGQRVLIDPSAVVLGEVTLEDDVSVWPQVAIRGDMHASGRRQDERKMAAYCISLTLAPSTRWLALTSVAINYGHRAVAWLHRRRPVGYVAPVMDGA
jgi:hypothetical protein